MILKKVDIGWSELPESSSCLLSLGWLLCSFGQTSQLSIFIVQIKEQILVFLLSELSFISITLKSPKDMPSNQSSVKLLDENQIKFQENLIFHLIIYNFFILRGFGVLGMR